MKRPQIIAVWAGAAVLTAAAATAQSPADQATPTFRSGVDVIPIDVTVVDGQGHPLRGLAASDFTVLIEGTPRRVVTAEWVSLAGEAPRPESPAADGYSSNDQITGGRLIVLAIDQPNIRFGGGRIIFEAINRFLDRLSPSDRVALVGLGRGTAGIPFTTDRERVKEAVARMNGQMESPQLRSTHSISLSSAVAIARESGELERVVERDCPPQTIQTARARELCRQEIQDEAAEIVRASEQPRDSTIQTLGNVLLSLASIDAPKALVLVSEGLAVFEGDAETAGQITTLAALAARARTTIYALRLADQLFNMTGGPSSASPFDDARFRTMGLETLANMARGALFTVSNSGEDALARVESELSGYYLLGVEAGATLRTDRASAVRITVAMNGVTVRTRPTISAPDETAAGPRSPQAAVAAALSAPLTLSALPLRVISFNFQGQDPAKVQLLMHADVGQGYTRPQSVAVAYLITDSAGRIVDSQATSGRLGPATAGLPSPLVFTAGASLAPGEYLLKLAAADGDKVGSVEHRFQVSLIDGGPLRFSDLAVGGPVPSGPAPLRPSIDYTVRFGVVHAYLEAYGASASGASVRYEVARDEQSPPLLGDAVEARQVGETRAVFSKLVSVASLPPGKYQLRAIVSGAGTRPAALSRPFEIAEPAALTSAAADAPRTGAVLRPATELFLPIDATDLTVPFQLADALRPDVLESFAARVPQSARREFDEGLEQLRTGAYAAAQDSFKRAIRPDLDFASAVSYLAVAFAAAGDDAEAAGAWQTALIADGNVPQIYAWLGDALLRMREFARARVALEEASRRWPSDTRFARPLAVLNATTGRGYEAIQRLQQYLAVNDDDPAALYLGVQWIYEVHLSGATIADRAADAALAQRYADAYRRAGGSKQPLVAQWLEYVSKSAR